MLPAPRPACLLILVLFSLLSPPLACVRRRELRRPRHVPADAQRALAYAVLVPPFRVVADCASHFLRLLNVTHAHSMQSSRNFFPLSTIGMWSFLLWPHSHFMGSASHQPSSSCCTSSALSRNIHRDTPSHRYSHISCTSLISHPLQELVESLVMGDVPAASRRQVANELLEPLHGLGRPDCAALAWHIHILDGWNI